MSLRWSLSVMVVLLFLSGAVRGWFWRQPTEEQVAYEIVELINEERRDLGVEPLLLNDQLTDMAVRRSQDMAAGDYYGHKPPEGHPTLRDMVEEMGYDFTSVPDENLNIGPVFLGRTSYLAEDAVESWKESRVHWRVAMSCGVAMTGVGVVFDDGKVVITQLFWDNGLFAPTEAWNHNHEAP
jgi:uncharacterized protein YkwD